MRELVPPSWTYAKIGDLVIEASYGTSAKTNGDATGVPVLRMGNIVSGKLDFSQLKYLPADHSEFPNLFLSAGDVLFNRTNSAELVGKTAVYRGTPNRCSFASYLIRIRLKGSLPDWVALYLNSPFGRACINEVVSQQVGQANVNGTKLKDFTIPLPPLPEQKWIVAKIEELFSELDAGEASLRKARRQLGVYRQSLLKQAFEGKLTQTWRTLNPDKLESPASLLARIQSARQSRHEQLLEEWKTAVREWESAETDEKRPPKPKKLIPIGENIEVFNTPLPEGWITLNLSQFVLELGQGWSPKCENHEAKGDEWAVIKTTAIQFGNLDPSANKALPKHLPPRRWLGLRSGEILITRAGPRSRCGVVCRVRGDHPRLMICDKAYRLVLFEGATSSEFVERLLCSPAATAAIEKLKTGINDSGVNITQSAFLQLALPIPSLPEQQEIVRILDEQFEAIERNERELDAALQRSEALIRPEFVRHGRLLFVGLWV